MPDELQDNERDHAEKDFLQGDILRRHGFEPETGRTLSTPE